jgi:hypothetical protein
VRLLANHLVKWQSLPGAQPLLSGKAVSLHLPLVRAVAAFLLNIFLANPNATMEDVLGAPVLSAGHFSEVLLRLPLRVQTFVSEARANMWVRNGQSCLAFAEAYRTIIPQDFFLLDFYAL